jgi:hypothetical protein
MLNACNTCATLLLPCLVIARTHAEPLPAASLAFMVGFCLSNHERSSYILSNRYTCQHRVHSKHLHIAWKFLQLMFVLCQRSISSATDAVMCQYRCLSFGNVFPRVSRQHLYDSICLVVQVVIHRRCYSETRREGDCLTVSWVDY